MKKILYSFIVLIVLSAPALADHYPRNNNINIIHYTFNLTLSDSSNVILGKAEIQIKFLKDDVKDFSLDLIGKSAPDSKTGMTVDSVTRNGKTLGFVLKNNKLNISLSSPAVPGEIRTFTVYYYGVPADGLIISKNKFGDRTFFGDNWPDRARNWLPCIDHPYDKARVDFIVTAPSKYQVIANGALAEETDLLNGMRRTHWKESEPLATKVMVIGAAKFAVQYLPEFNCTPIETWVYPQDRDKGFYDFEVAENVINLYSNYIGPYPYEKLANVESKTRYGGMENASNIFYAESRVTGKRLNEATVAHEIAHQWFGDAVSENDWDHIWLSEGFADFFQSFYISRAFGDDSTINLYKRFRGNILAYYKRHPDAPVVDTTVTDLMKLLNVNSYQKGAWVLRMLRHTIGERKFWNGIKAYYKKYRNGNALTSDFEKVMEETSGINLNWFFDEWLYKPGQPDIKGTWSYDAKDKKLSIDLEQIQRNGNIFTMPVDFAVYTGGSDDAEVKRFRMDEKNSKFSMSLNTKPDSVVIDPGTYLLMTFEFKKR